MNDKFLESPEPPSHTLHHEKVSPSTTDETKAFNPTDLFKGQSWDEGGIEASSPSWQKYCDGRLQQFAAFR